MLCPSDCVGGMVEAAAARRGTVKMVPRGPQTFAFAMVEAATARRRAVKALRKEPQTFVGAMAEAKGVNH